MCDHIADHIDDHIADHIDDHIADHIDDHIAAQKVLRPLSMSDSMDDQQFQCMDFALNNTPVLKGTEVNFHFRYAVHLDGIQ